MAWLGYSIHGTSIEAEVAGPDYFENIAGIGFTDVLGYRRGWGTTYRGKANKFGWFHYSPPHLDNYEHRSTALYDVIIQFLTSGTARVDSVHIWSGHVRVATFDNLGNAGDFRQQATMGKNWWLWQNGLNLPNGALGISIGVPFGAQVSDVLFTQAHVSFISR